jgi:hypothetical protein
MISFDAFLISLAAAALPVIYLTVCSRWIEPAYRIANWSPEDGAKSAQAQPAATSRRVASAGLKNRLTEQTA